MSLEMTMAEQITELAEQITEAEVKKWCYKRNLVLITKDLYLEMRRRWSTVQPEIVRCKECLLHEACAYERGLGKDGFCSQGKRLMEE